MGKKPTVQDRILKKRNNQPEVPGLKPGVPVRKAEGAKTVRPGDKDTTTARRIGAYETKSMSMAKDRKKGLVDPNKLNDMRRFFRKKDT